MLRVAHGLPSRFLDRVTFLASRPTIAEVPTRTLTANFVEIARIEIIEVAGTPPPTGFPKVDTGDKNTTNNEKNYPKAVHVLPFVVVNPERGIAWLDNREFGRLVDINRDQP